MRPAGREFTKSLKALAVTGLAGDVLVFADLIRQGDFDSLRDVLAFLLSHVTDGRGLTTVEYDVLFDAFSVVEQERDMAVWAAGPVFAPEP